MPETRHQIGAREFGLMKKTAFIINTARGADHRREGAGARAEGAARSPAPGSTCSSNEPKVPTELKKMKNVVLAPHLGSATVEVREEMANIVVDNIQALIDGRRPPNCVNPEVLPQVLKPS